MNTRNIKYVCIIMTVCVLLFVLMGAGYDKENDTVKDLLTKRVAIMNSALKGEITLDKTKKLLKDIETGKLYSDDIDALTASMNTDQEQVTEMKIVSIVKKHHVSDIVCYEAVVKWQYHGNNNTSGEMCCYNVGVKECSEKEKLVSFELIQ